VIPLTLWDAGIGFVYPRSKLTERRLQANNVKLDDAKSWPELRDNLANLQLLQEGLLHELKKTSRRLAASNRHRPPTTCTPQCCSGGVLLACPSEGRNWVGCDSQSGAS